jgi:D-alanyl-D-alanine carboxypeptidase
VFETRYFTFNGRKYRNHNKLLFGYQGCDGIKTGYTKASGFNLTASVHRGNKHLVAVVLGGKTGGQRDAAMRSVLDRHFAKATDTKPTPAQLLASLVPAPSPPAVQKPAYTLAPPTPVPSAPTAPAAEASTDTPADTATDTEEGDTGDPAEPIKASLTVTEPAPKATIKPSKYQGAFQVQVGAFTSEAEAENRLGMVQQRASDLLDGHMPFTTSFMRADEEWYRARFAGFSRKSAQAACAALKKMSLDCAVMKAE